MAASKIPNELLVTIFELATTDDNYRDELPTSMDSSSWFKTVFGVWSLQSPEELSINAQKRRYKTIRAILCTCRIWHQIGGEFLYKYISIFRPSELHKLQATFSREATLGWWTQRIYFGGSAVMEEDSIDALVSIIRHCPNIEKLIITWPLSASFSAVIADTLQSFTSKSLRTLSWAASCTALPKSIWTINSLRKSLQVLQLEFEDGDDDDNIVPLGAAANLNITLPVLRRLSLRGAFAAFLEQCSEWNMPSLDHVALDFVDARDNIPDVNEFLAHHGANLTFLDLHCLQTLDVAKILDQCPQLKTFAFNPDWRLPNSDDFPTTAKLVNRPHPNITHIGLHQLMYAFGVGYAATYSQVDPFSSLYIRASNDYNFAALTKQNFPSLQCVRLLSRALLSELESADGPNKQCFPRWEKWWEQCVKQGIRLEDCTSAFLGTLPQDEKSDEESSEEEDDEEEEDFENEYEDEDDTQTRGDVVLSELRELLAECRRMAADREESRYPGLQLQPGFL